MSEIDPQPLSEALVKMGLLTAGQLDAMLTVQRRDGRRLSEQLVAGGFLTEERLVQILSEQLGVETADLKDIWVHDEVRAMVLASVARRLSVLPLSRRRIGDYEALMLAMVDPLDDDAVAVVTRRLPDDMRIIRLLASEPDLKNALDVVYGLPQEAPADAGRQLSVDDLKLPSGAVSELIQSDVASLGIEATIREADVTGLEEPQRDAFGDPPTTPGAGFPDHSDDQQGVTEAAVPAYVMPEPAHVDPEEGEPQKTAVIHPSIASDTTPAGASSLIDTLLLPRPELSSPLIPAVPQKPVQPSDLAEPAEGATAVGPPPRPVSDQAIVTPVAMHTPSGGTQLPSDRPHRATPSGGTQLPSDRPHRATPSGGTQLPSDRPHRATPSGGTKLPSDRPSVVAGAAVRSRSASSPQAGSPRPRSGFNRPLSGPIVTPLEPGPTSGSMNVLQERTDRMSSGGSVQGTSYPKSAGMGGPKSNRSPRLRAPATEVVRPRGARGRDKERRSGPSEPRRRIRDVTRRMDAPAAYPLPRSSLETAPSPAPAVIPSDRVLRPMHANEASSRSRADVKIRAIGPKALPAFFVVVALLLVLVVGIGTWRRSVPPVYEARIDRSPPVDQKGVPDPPLAPIRSDNSKEVAPGIIDAPPPPGHRFVATDGLELRATASSTAEPLLWLKAGQLVRLLRTVDDFELVLVPPNGPAGFVKASMLSDRLPVEALARKMKYKMCVVPRGGLVDDCLYGARTQWEDCRFHCRPGTRCEEACQVAF
ncbi:MAG: hypothetical protein AAF449_15930, partial [Myxococcota bacterium]